MKRQDYFEAKLAYETDASDLYNDLKANRNVVVVDVRDAAAWAQGRVPGAVHMHYSEMLERAPNELTAGAEVVVYCWSPGCNAGAKGAAQLAALGYSVRELIGGWEYWVREGYPIEDAEGVHRRPVDPLVGVPRVRSRA